MEESLDQKSALKILINAVHIGQTRGAWKLDEVPTLLRAIDSFTTDPSQSQKSEESSQHVERGV